jgi:hypothetical protein
MIVVSLNYDHSFIVLANGSTIVDYDRKNFIVQATGVKSFIALTPENVPAFSLGEVVGPTADVEVDGGLVPVEDAEVAATAPTIQTNLEQISETFYKRDLQL